MQSLRVLTRSGAAPTAEEIAAAHIVANTHKEMKFGTILATERANGVEVEYHAHKNMAFVSGGSGLFGGTYLDTLYARNCAWYGGLTRMQGLGAFPGSTSDSASCVKRVADGVVVYGRARVNGGRWRGIFWGVDGNPVDLAMPGLLGTVVPNGGFKYSQSIVVQVSPDGSTALAKMMTDGLLWPRAYLWSRHTGARDLGFMDDVKINLPSYVFGTSNWVDVIGMSDDRAVVFANHRAETFNDGGHGGYGAVWNESTGWVRVPVPAGYVPKTPGAVDTAVDHVKIFACSADGASLVGQVHNVTLARPIMPVIWREGVGTEVLPILGTADSGYTLPIAMSRSGEFVLMVNYLSGDTSVWSEATGLVPIPLFYERYGTPTRFAVDDDGTAYGKVRTASGDFAARHSLTGVTTVYETPAGAVSSAPAFIGRSYVAGTHSAEYVPTLWRHAGALITVPSEVSGLANPVIRAVPDAVPLPLGGAFSHYFW